MAALLQASRRPVGARRAQILAWLGFGLAVVYYATLIFAGKPGFFPPIERGLTFNSMLLHLLAGRFDVDPQVIGLEGFARGGAVYAYFGIFPALLRLPLLALPGFSGTDFTALSCLLAVSLMALFKLLSLLTVWRAVGGRHGGELAVLLGIALLFSGAQVQFLRPSLYDEVSLWADVLAAAFVYLVLRGYCAERGLTGGLLAWLALAAGLCLLTRVSTALGLYVAFGLLWLQVAGRRVRANGAAGVMPLLAPLLILAACVAVTAVVNYQRWGNPLAFMDARYYLDALLRAPDRLQRVQQYGQFNPIRIGYGLVYYFFPVWVLHGADGHLLWTQFQQRTIDVVELPPGSFLLSDPLLLGLTVYTLVHLVWRRDIAKPAIAVSSLAGLAIPIVLMLSFIWMTFRYRLEFYPLFEFCAFIGLFRLISGSPAPRTGWFKAAAYTGVVVALFAFYIYRISPYGTASVPLAKTDLISFYGTLLPR